MLPGNSAAKRFFTTLLNHKNKFSLFVLLFILFGIYCFVFGDSGMLERMRLKSERKELVQQIQVLQRENKNLKNLLYRYRNGEFIREEAQRAGFIKPGEKAFFTKGITVPEKVVSNEIKNVYGVKIEYLRIFWIVISALIVLMYLFVRKDKDPNE